ncbi:MAG: hypothetical protein AAF394_01655 [Planctomycetota bacterium]
MQEAITGPKRISLIPPRTLQMLLFAAFVVGVPIWTIISATTWNLLVSLRNSFRCSQ